jgi:hypothetical protein
VPGYRAWEPLRAPLAPVVENSPLTPVALLQASPTSTKRAGIPRPLGVNLVRYLHELYRWELASAVLGSPVSVRAWRSPAAG